LFGAVEAADLAEVLRSGEDQVPHLLREPGHRVPCALPSDICLIANAKFARLIL
jgi:hypothetical protein